MVDPATEPHRADPQSTIAASEQIVELGVFESDAGHGHGGADARRIANPAPEPLGSPVFRPFPPHRPACDEGRISSLVDPEGAIALKIRKTRYAMVARTGGDEPPIDALRRPLWVTDDRALAALIEEAFRGTLDDDGTTLEDVQYEVRRVYAGRYGPILWPCSFVQTDGTRRLVGASVITDHPDGDALLAYTAVAPDYRRQGIARTLIRASLAALADNGYDEVRLYVTEGNSPAIVLYRSLGFEREPGTTRHYG